MKWNSTEWTAKTNSSAKIFFLPGVGRGGGMTVHYFLPEYSVHCTCTVYSGKEYWKSQYFGPSKNWPKIRKFSGKLKIELQKKNDIGFKKNEIVEKTKRTIL